LETRKPAIAVPKRYPIIREFDASACERDAPL
jgi:hypothetical protein